MIQINLQILNGRDRTLHFLLYHYFCYFLSLSRSFLVVSVKFEEIKLAPIPVYHNSCPLGWPWITFTGSHLVRPPYCFNLKCKSNSPHGTAAQPFSAGFCFNFFVIYVWDWPIVHCLEKISASSICQYLVHTLSVFLPSKLKRRYLSAKNDIVEFTI